MPYSGYFAPLRPTALQCLFRPNALYLSKSKMITRFRAEQVGSLLRPPELLAARSEHAAGQIPLDELRRREDQAILAALKKQRSIGLERPFGRRDAPFLLAHRHG